MGTEIYPLTLEPIVAEQFWGQDPDLPQDDNLPPGFLGTLWMATDNSRISAGPQAGRGLAYLRQIWSGGLVGAVAGANPDRLLPVELKLKRTGAEALAVALTEDSLWYFLAAEEDSSINAGFRAGLDFQKAAAEAGRDPGRWSEYMPEYPVEAGRCLFLPKFSPLLLGAGLTVAQIGAPARSLSGWPLSGFGPEGLSLAEEAGRPSWLEPEKAGEEMTEIYRVPTLTVTLVRTAQLSTVVSQEAATFIWPIAGQGRIRARGPAPVTRLTPGKVVMIPASLGRYAVESGGQVSYLLIEAC